MRSCLLILLALMLCGALVAAVPLMMVNLALSEAMVLGAIEGANIPAQFTALVLAELEAETVGQEGQFALLLLRELNPGEYVEEALKDNIAPLLRYLKGQGEFPSLVIDFSPLKEEVFTRLREPEQLLAALEENYPQEYAQLEPFLQDPKVVSQIVAQLEEALNEEFPQSVNLVQALGSNEAEAREALAGTRQVIKTTLRLSRIGLAAVVVLFIFTLLAGWLRPGLFGTGIALVAAGVITALVGLLPRMLLSALTSSLAGQDVGVEFTGLITGPVAMLLRWPIYAAAGYTFLGAALIFAGYMHKRRDDHNLIPGKEGNND